MGAEIPRPNIGRLLSDRCSSRDSLGAAVRACAAIARPRALLSQIETARINRLVARLRNSP